MFEDTIKIDNETAKSLKNTVTEIEMLQKQIEIIKGQITEAFSFAKGQGFEPKIIKKVLKLRKLDEKRREELDQDDDIAKFLETKITETEAKDFISNLIENKESN